MKVSLTDICDFQGGTQPPKDEWINQPAQGYVRMLQIRDFTQSDKNYIEYVKDTGKLKTCIEDDILIGRYGASIGKILTGLAGAYNVAIVKTIPDEKVVSKKYLYWYLNSQYFQRFISNVGSRAAQAGFNKNDLGAAQIPLVDKERQEEICEVLEKANKLISLRKQQLAKLDKLVKARFVEMFGDPYVNNKHYPLRKGESFFKLSNGKGVPEDKRLSNGVPAYGGNGISWYTNESLFNYDTIVVGRVGFQSGNVHIAKGPLWITDNAMYMSSCDFSQYNLIFLINLMEHIDFTRFQDAGDLKKITQKPFMQYEYLCPPLSLQNQFAAFVERVNQQKQTVQQSLEKLELMKKALMQEYFG